MPIANKDGYLKRHKGCYTTNGVHRYDPIRYDILYKNGFVCEVCGFRYVRPSTWDFMDFILDEKSFVEHAETKLIIDKDILGFPNYMEKLNTTRKQTGLMTAMITGDAKIKGNDVIFCGVDFGFLGASFCMTTGEKIWRTSELAIKK